jgi:hypothetical protein
MTDPLSPGERARVRGDAPSTVDHGAESHAPEAQYEPPSPGRVLGEPQDARVVGRRDEWEQSPAEEAPSTPVARPLTLFDIPVFAVDPPAGAEPHAYTDAEAVACSLENPEYCEACQ